MIFSIVTNLAFAFLGPLGAACVVVGDWWFNAYMAAKVVETVVPNGPAIVGNVSLLLPVIMDTLYSAAEPVMALNYSELLSNYAPRMNLTDLGGNVTILMEQVANLTHALKGANGWE
jgi:hypothetical protein